MKLILTGFESKQEMVKLVTDFSQTGDSIINPCMLTVNQVETLATCDDLRNVLYLGRPPSVNDQLRFCDITSENQSEDRRLCDEI